MDVTYDLNLTHNFLVRTSSMASVATVNGGRGGLEEGRLEVEEEGLLYFLEVAGLEQVPMENIRFATILYWDI